MNKIVLRPIITVEDKNAFISEIQEASAEQSSL